MLPTRDELLRVHERIKPFIHFTPVLQSSLLNEITGANVFFKCENFQKMGAFKMRGAMNAILQLSEEEKKAGVVTHSSGNFGQAVALAARNAGVTAYIVMPANAPSVKKKAVKDYGGLVTECESTLKARVAESERIQREHGATPLHPSNQIEVILGNATAAMELLSEHPDLDFVFTPIGGGGLVAGTALATHYFGTNCKTIGGEPYEADDAYRSLQSGKIESNITTNTIADGLRTELGSVNFPIIKALVPEIIRVTEEEIVQALRLIWERMKIIVEPSCAVPFAALLKEKDRFKGNDIGIIISGGNVDLSNLPFAK
ncbi:MAG: threonine/serine dehydratase [Bacteroidia bacterium]|nr:threonine/serine dehydratase [Bacteroidia bacterium]NNF31598.1 threonine/serine dehydratase [Flavobacteriaceae bacterium]MBT8275256.1 threonine/serine dehydratase [Bacteroidia bacterium]NNJ83234.1 threonine/serine dehydratase [Flavobacteriaceae bacterium]NNK53288.1 threonine/serine dehydratase [Flavobacteriaceae bacterium]